MKRHHKLMRNPHFGIFLKLTNQSAVHSQREQSGLGAVQVNTKKKVYDGFVVGLISAQVCPTGQRVVISLQAEHCHCFSSILIVIEKIETVRQSIHL